MTSKAHTTTEAPDDLDDKQPGNGDPSPDAPAEAPPGATDVQVLLPEPGQLRLESGTLIELRKLKSQEMFLLLKIVTTGLGGHLGGLAQLDSADDEDVFIKKLLAMTVLALPNAFPETAAFIRAMVAPVGLIGSGANKADKARNRTRTEELDEQLANPSLDDLLTIVEAIVRREAPDLRALGKRLAAMVLLVRATG